MLGLDRVPLSISVLFYGMLPSPKNDRDAPLTRFCLAMERFRREDEDADTGAVRTAAEMVAEYFPYSADSAEDRLFHLLPREIRGSILAAWGIRGIKSAQRDDDARVKTIVHDALVAGDIDADTFEEGITPDILIDWVSLPGWWRFFRGSELDLRATRRALFVARELELFDDRWFLLQVRTNRGNASGTNALADPLRKDQVMAWLRGIHLGGDASPSGLVAALGWQTILDTVAHEALLAALDTLAREIGLVDEPILEASPISSSRAQADPEPELGFATAPPIAEPVTFAAPPPDEPEVITPLVAQPLIFAEADEPQLHRSEGTTALLPAAMTTPPEDPLMDSELRALFDSERPPGIPSPRPPQPAPPLLSSIASLGPGASARPATPSIVEEDADVRGDDLVSFAPPADESWWPERAEPGDMGFDLAYGVGQGIALSVRPRYDFSDDDGEPTHELPVPEKRAQ